MLVKIFFIARMKVTVIAIIFLGVFGVKSLP